jgi:hypothetical protein
VPRGVNEIVVGGIKSLQKAVAGKRNERFELVSG